jgi:hypothetical protein
MNEKHSVVIKRLETLVAELECEFLYLLNDMYIESRPQAGQLQSMVANLRLARYFLAAAGAEAQRNVAFVAAE